MALEPSANSVIEDNCALVQFEEKFGVTHFDSNDKPICARPASRGRTCANDAGWGTDHRGMGPCLNHGGVPSGTISIDPKNNMTLVIQNEQLRALVAAEYTAQDVDSLDDEIVLMKAMIKLLAANFGVKVYWDKDEAKLEEQEDMEGWRGLTEQSREISRTIMMLANTIKSKYQVLAVSRESIPRPEVRAYIMQVVSIIQSSLRNTCSECGHESNDLNNVIDSIQMLGGI